MRGIHYQVVTQTLILRFWLDAKESANGLGLTTESNSMMRGKGENSDAQSSQRLTQKNGESARIKKSRMVSSAEREVNSAF